MTTENSKVHPKKTDMPLETKSESQGTSVASISPTHCPYRQAMLLQKSLASDKMRVAFLLGAGCPVSIRVSDGQNSKPLKEYGVWP